MSRISAPMFSPSLSQSVQMNSMLQRDAWCLMLSAIPSMFCPSLSKRSRLRARTHFGNRLLDWRIQQLARLHGLPVVVRRAKVVPHQMPRHAREHDAALAPRRAEGVVEAKVLDVRSGDVGLSGHVSSTSISLVQPTPWTFPARWPTTARAMEPFSATHSTLRTILRSARLPGVHANQKFLVIVTGQRDDHG
jgi:hypothetical protein